jgi:zinc protease
MGGVYDVAVWGKFEREPVARPTLTISFDCDPENVDKLRDATFAEIAKIQKEGLDKPYTTKLVEQLRRSHEVNLTRNTYWVDVLRTAYQYGDKVANLIDVEASTRRVSRANIGAAAVRFSNDKNTLIGVLRPKSQP